MEFKVIGTLLYLILLALSQTVTPQPAVCINWLQVFPNCPCRSAIDGAGQELTSAASVDCRSKGLTSVPQKQRDSQRTLYEFLLNDNQITTLPDDAFQGIKIRHLDLDGNRLGDISDNAFRGTENEIISLRIEGNSVALPQKNALRTLNNLEGLKMKNYSIVHLEQFFFNSFRNLRALTLENWGIQSIDANAFVAADGHQSLRSLALINQDLVTLPLDVLHNAALQNLESLQISHTRVHTVTPYAFNGLQRIKEINLSHNGIRSIEEDSFTGIGDTLIKLDLSNNFLGGDSHDDLSHLRSMALLKNISLSNNEFRLMPKMRNLGNGQALSVDLSKNALIRVSVDDLSSYTTRLQGLDLGHNKIVHIDDNTFANLSVLNSLTLSNQKISPTTIFRVPTSLTQAANTLTYLDLSEQRLESTGLWQTLKRLEKLQTLTLRNTVISAIPDLVFRNTINLTTLDLSYNYGITRITDNTFVGPQALKTLSLRSTSIRTIPACLLSRNTGTLSLDMGFVQIECNCSVKTLLEKIHTGSIVFPDVNSAPTCSDGSSLIHLDLSELTCDPQICANDEVTSPSPQPQSTDSTTDSPSQTSMIQMRVLNISHSTIGIAWDLNESRDFQKFRIRLSSDKLVREIDIVSVGVNQQQVEDLTADTHYRVCVYAYFSSVPPVSDCQSVRTKCDPNLPHSDLDRESSEPTPTVQIRVVDIGTSSMRIAWDMTNTTELLYYTVTVSSTHTTTNYDQRSFNVTNQNGNPLVPNTHQADVCVYAYFTSGRPVSLCESVSTKTDPN